MNEDATYESERERLLRKFAFLLGWSGKHYVGCALLETDAGVWSSDWSACNCHIREKLLELLPIANTWLAEFTERDKEVV